MLTFDLHGIYLCWYSVVPGPVSYICEYSVFISILYKYMQNIYNTAVFGISLKSTCQNVLSWQMLRIDK